MGKRLGCTTALVVVLGLNGLARGGDGTAAPAQLSQVKSTAPIKPNYVPYGISNHELIGVETGARIAAGIVYFKDKDFPYVMHYDEVLICKSVKGRFEIVVEGKAQRMVPGDMVYLPEGSHVRYRSVGEAVMYFAVTPADWLKRVPPEELKAAGEQH